MSRYDYDLSKHISVRDESFYALLFALIRRADDENIDKIKKEWPDAWDEFYQRYHAPGGFLPGESDDNSTTT